MKLQIKKMTDQELVSLIGDRHASIIDRASAAQIYRKKHSLKPDELAADLDLSIRFAGELLDIAKLPKVIMERLRNVNVEPWIMVQYRKDMPKASEEEMLDEIDRLERWNNEASKWDCARMAGHDNLDDVCKVIEKATVVACIVSNGRWKLDNEIKSAIMPALHSALQFLQGRAEVHTDESERLMNDQHVNSICRKRFHASINNEMDLTDKSSAECMIKSEYLLTIIHAAKLTFDRLSGYKPNGWWHQSTHTMNDTAALAGVFADRAMEAIAAMF